MGTLFILHLTVMGTSVTIRTLAAAVLVTTAAAVARISLQISEFLDSSRSVQLNLNLRVSCPTLGMIYKTFQLLPRVLASLELRALARPQ